jgi:glycosyltransferase involved in cell wall biosynthesis
MQQLRRLRSFLRWSFQRPAVRWPSGIAAIGSVAAARYRSMAADTSPVENIPYFCDTAAFGAIPRSPSRSRREVRFLFCGQLIHRKGVDLLMRAFQRLEQRYPHVSLTLVGEGPMRKALERQFPGASARVRFEAFQQIPQLPRYFADADVFILPSRHDGWGVVVNQAIAAGLAVICTKAVGAAADLVGHDINGLVVPADDEDALFEAMQFYADEPRRTMRHGTASRNVSRQWTLDRGVDRWYQFCRRVLDTKASPNRNATVGRASASRAADSAVTQP